MLTSQLDIEISLSSLLYDLSLAYSTSVFMAIPLFYFSKVNIIREYSLSAKESNEHNFRNCHLFVVFFGHLAFQACVVYDGHHGLVASHLVDHLDQAGLVVIMVAL